MTITTTEQTLSQELAAVEADYPGWLLHPSDQGIIWIDSVSGCPTFRAATPLAARYAIAGWEHLMDVRYGASKAVAA